MKTTKLHTRIIAFCCSVLLLFAAFASPAAIGVELSSDDQQKIDSYKQQQEELNKKIEESKQKINDMQDDIEQQRSYVQELTEQINAYQKIIDSLEADINALEVEKQGIQIKVDELDAQILAIETEINHNELEQISLDQQSEDIVEDLKECLCNLYVNGSTSELELLLSSTDFSSFLITLELSSNMAKQDDELINNLKLDIARIEELNGKQKELIAEIEVKKSELDAQIKELEAKESVIEASKAEQQKSQDAISALYSEATSYLAVLDKQSAAYADLVAGYEAEIAAFDKKIDAIVQNASRGSGQVGPGGMIWPLQYGSDVYISSGFGYRSDPATGATKFHGGIDTCCWSGTYGKNVVAAASGTVIISTWHSSYGYYVGIDHGNGVVTIYAHNSELLVSVGQSVSQGQTIAHAGSTGYSTGAHCHFEVRVNGEKVSPLGYASP